MSKSSSFKPGRSSSNRFSTPANRTACFQIRCDRTTKNGVSRLRHLHHLTAVGRQTSTKVWKETNKIAHATCSLFCNLFWVWQKYSPSISSHWNHPVVRFHFLVVSGDLVCFHRKNGAIPRPGHARVWPGVCGVGLVVWPYQGTPRTLTRARQGIKRGLATIPWPGYQRYPGQATPGYDQKHARGVGLVEWPDQGTSITLTRACQGNTCGLANAPWSGYQRYPGQSTPRYYTRIDQWTSLMFDVPWSGYGHARAWSSFCAGMELCI